jgi:DNA helicase-2/ATP-dependent DNA helicase PcrA
MNLSENEIKLEEKHLNVVTKELRLQISEMAQELYDKEEKQKEFKKFLWDNKTSLDPVEMKTFMSNNDLEINMLLDKAKHYRSLYKIQNSPFFGSVKFKSDEGTENIYIGLTYLTKDYENLIYD